MTTDEIMLFDKWPNVLPLYAALREKLLSAYPETVSYTHLDVYKRQAWR